MHVSAQIDSRLAGAGLLILPQSVSVLGAAVPEDEDDDPVVSALIEMMVTPIRDRDNASAVVPGVFQVPDEAVGKIQHLSFASPLDSAAKDLRDEAIRRLALGLDAPPERLLGMANASHWASWFLSEDEAKLHVHPLLSLILDAVTSQYLRIVLEDSGVEDFNRYAVFADTSALTLRPDRSADGFQLHGLGLISDETLRAVTGFGPEDAAEKRDPATEMALRMVLAQPALLQSPGLPALINQLRDVLGSPDVSVSNLDERENNPAVTDGPPATQDSSPPSAGSGVQTSPTEAA